ncbi:hypothetical protein ACBY01_01530 [Sphingomonas sp. ac-8]|uniref:hypothetical protein n=1 Tax=Sphingomonas sp. ac-8 TaxID=3242977 RepID=UPI003A80B11A
MTNLWNMGPSIAAGERLNRLVDRDPPAFAWVNRAQYADAIQAGGSVLDEDGFGLGQVRGVDLSSLPRPRLQCTEPDFAPDLIFWGELFASARLVAALELDASSVQLIEVDCDECPPAVQAAGYRLLNLLTFANPMDIERSEPADFFPFRNGDGEEDHVWLFEGAGPGDPAPHIVWRDGFTPPASLFRVPGRPWALATESLADFVAAGGFQDVAFYDLTARDRLTERESGALR